METRKKYLFLFVAILCIACNEDYIPSEYSLSSGEVNGFSFDKMNVVNKPITTHIYTDFIVAAGLNETGEFVSPFFTQLDFKSYFVLSKQFDNLQSAQHYFDSYITMTEDKSYFDIVAMPVQPYQIWIVKTQSDTYGKILILSTISYSSNHTTYCSVRFKAEKLK
jgi:hypothetical protein